MSFSSILYNLIIAPIEIVIEWVFIFYNKKIGIGGMAGAILAVSLAVNFLALPLYNIADSLQEKERNIQMSLAKWVKHIKKHFKGDERFMMLQAYYRENNYHPLYALRSSLSILIEIPFFIAAYHYLSHSSALQGIGFAFLNDLGAPDSLIKIPFAEGKTFNINILPILMTLINFISGAIYLKKAPLKEKIQLYALALVFLFLLYNSPSGLVCYWILNNVFSLVKNIVMQRKNPKKILHVIVSVILSFLTIFFLFSKGAIIKKASLLLLTVFIVTLPVIAKCLKKLRKTPSASSSIISKSNFTICFISGLGTAILTGLLLPSIIISSSPLEFSFLGNTASPISYIYSSFSVFFGFFVFWPCVIYLMFGNKTKSVLSLLSFLILALSLANAFLFKYNYGLIDIFFNIKKDSMLKDYSLFFTVVPFVFFISLLVLWEILRKKAFLKFFATISLILCIAQLPMSFANINKINNKFNSFVKNRTLNDGSDEETNVIHLSKTKKNVIVLFMDRSIGCYLPYFFEQFPQYKKSFDGFVNYENSLSYGAYTLSGSPAMFGGYEYTPEEMAKRNTELLVKKHNEATILLPTLFSEKGWFSTIINPPWPNYKDAIEKDYSEFDGVQNVSVKNLLGVLSGKYKQDVFDEKRDTVLDLDKVCRRNILDFNILQILPPMFRNSFHHNFRTKLLNIEDFINTFSALYYINDETDFTSDNDNYVFYANETIHEPTFLNESFSYPVYEKNNNTGIYKTYNDEETQLYEVYCAAFIKIAQYLDYLRANNAYDNSRIIIVSDHGYHINMTHYNNFDLNTVKDSIYDFTKGERQIPSSFDCTLMFKDFNSTGSIKNDTTFMTNADAFFLAKKDLNLSDTNPFTGKKFVQNKENGINTFFQIHGEIDAPNMLNKTHITFDEQTAWHFNPGAINDPKNWIPYKKWKENNNSENTK